MTSPVVDSIVEKWAERGCFDSSMCIEDSIRAAVREALETAAECVEDLNDGDLYAEKIRELLGTP